jgi:hypothetical protein
MMKPVTFYDFRPVTDYCVKTARHYDRNHPSCQKLLRIFETRFNTTCEKVIEGHWCESLPLARTPYFLDAGKWLSFDIA